MGWDPQDSCPGPLHPREPAEARQGRKGTEAIGQGHGERREKELEEESQQVADCRPDRVDRGMEAEEAGRGKEDGRRARFYGETQGDAAKWGIRVNHRDSGGREKESQGR